MTKYGKCSIPLQQCSHVCDSNYLCCLFFFSLYSQKFFFSKLYELWCKINKDLRQLVAEVFSIYWKSCHFYKTTLSCHNFISSCIILTTSFRGFTSPFLFVISANSWRKTNIELNLLETSHCPEGWVRHAVGILLIRPTCALMFENTLEYSIFCLYCDFSNCANAFIPNK